MDNITEILERNAREWGDDVALVEIDTPDDGKRRTWKESELVESVPDKAFRVEMTWREFDEKANRFANFLLSRGFGKGDKIAILLMNCLEWLPIYFGVLKAGCMAVPLNFRYTADEIMYCLDLADAAALVFGPEFTGRVEQIADRMPKVRARIYVGEDCPVFAENYHHLVRLCTAESPNIPMLPAVIAPMRISSAAPHGARSRTRSRPVTRFPRKTG